MFLEVYPLVLGISTVKVCSRCGEVKPADSAHFSVNGDKLRSYCKQCARGFNHEYYANNADSERARSKAYHQAHGAEKREEKRVYDREYSRINSAKKRLKTAEFRKNNPEYMIEWRVNNAERLREWRKSEDGRRASGAIAHRRRARKLKVGGSYTAADIEDIRKAQGNRCYLCGKSLVRGYHVDHFIPLALGGSNNPGNLRLACPKCNLSKGAKHPHDMGRLI